jgi:predicted DNA-binding protein
MAQAQNTKRVTATVTSDTFERLQYWADKKGISINQYLNEAIDDKIAWENQDYPLPTLEQARLNQLVDNISILSSNVKSLESVITSGLDSLLGLTRGDNYLLEHEDGEI